MVDGTGLIVRILAVGLDVVLSILILATVFALLAIGERMGSRWHRRKRRQLIEDLQTDELSEDQLNALFPYVDYVARYNTSFKPIAGVAAAVSLAYLSIKASNTTYLATSYGITSIVFVVLSAIEVIRFRRARRINRVLHARPTELAASGDNLFPFTVP